MQTLQRAGFLLEVKTTLLSHIDFPETISEIIVSYAQSKPMSRVLCRPVISSVWLDFCGVFITESNVCSLPRICLFLFYLAWGITIFVVLGMYNIFFSLIPSTIVFIMSCGIRNLLGCFRGEHCKCTFQTDEEEAPLLNESSECTCACGLWQCVCCSNQGNTLQCFTLSGDHLFTQILKNNWDRITCNSRGFYVGFRQYVQYYAPYSFNTKLPCDHPQLRNDDLPIV
jgi:hypothetical protein